MTESLEWCLVSQQELWLLNWFYTCIGSLSFIHHIVSDRVLPLICWGLALSTSWGSSAELQHVYINCQSNNVAKDLKSSLFAVSCSFVCRFPFEIPKLNISSNHCPVECLQSGLKRWMSWCFRQHVTQKDVNCSATTIWCPYYSSFTKSVLNCFIWWCCTKLPFYLFKAIRYLQRIRIHHQIYTSNGIQTKFKHDTDRYPSPYLSITPFPAWTTT